MWKAVLSIIFTCQVDFFITYTAGHRKRFEGSRGVDVTSKVSYENLGHIQF